MTEHRRWADLTNLSFTLFVPAVLLTVTVVLFMNTADYEVLGLYAIFSAFVGGVLLVATSLILLSLPKRFTSASFAGTLFLFGLSLSVSAVLLYLVYGCVFGCPG